LKTAVAACLVLSLAGAGWWGLSTTRPREWVVAGYSTTLAGRTPNQRYNAIRALEKLQGKVIKPGETFSFNRAVRSWSRDQGFRRAPVSFSGTLVPAYGGGVCQTSTTLYNAALLAGLPIVERHPHRFAPSYVPPGRDSAVAFESVDLKITNSHPFPLTIRGQVRQDQLLIQLMGPKKPSSIPLVREEVRRTSLPRTVEWARTQGAGMRRVRSSGRAGFDVLVWRIWGDRRELISQNSYPAMDRVIEVAGEPYCHRSWPGDGSLARQREESPDFIRARCPGQPGARRLDGKCHRNKPPRLAGVRVKS